VTCVLRAAGHQSFGAAASVKRRPLQFAKSTGAVAPDFLAKQEGTPCVGISLVGDGSR
jgi:hypothetical protein